MLIEEFSLNFLELTNGKKYPAPTLYSVGTVDGSIFQFFAISPDDIVLMLPAIITYRTTAIFEIENILLMFADFLRPKARAAI